jgi:hypothetical protein
MLFLALNQNVPGSVSLVLDEAGESILLDAIRRAKTQSHVHLANPGAGGTELDADSPWGHEALVSELVITWDGEDGSA